MVKWSRHRSGVAQRVGRGIALLFHDRCTRRGWAVSNMPRPHFTPGKDSVPVLQKAGWTPGPVWTGGKSRPHRDSIPDRPARSSVAIPTELPGPQCLWRRKLKILSVKSRYLMKQHFTVKWCWQPYSSIVYDFGPISCLTKKDIVPVFLA